MLPELRQTILDNLRELSTPERPVYLVGGAVRDLLLNRPVHDLDFVLAGGTRSLAREMACRLNGALYMLDAERDTTRVVLNIAEKERLMLDFAGLRAIDLESDLRARDFTINAMAFDVARPEHLIDPTGGLADLRGKHIRACGPDSLEHDPVRILRAVRQALSFHFRIDPDTLRLMRAAVSRLPAISMERLRDELFRMLEGAQVATAVRILDQIGALDHVLPELEHLKGVTQRAPHVEDVWNHTLSTVQRLEELLAALLGAYHEEKVPDLTVGSAVLWLGRYREQLAAHFRKQLVPDRSLRALLFLAALYHDVAKPETRTEDSAGRARFLNHPELGARQAARRARELAVSSAEISRLETIIKQHMRVHFMAEGFKPAGKGHPDWENGPSRRTIYRFFKDTGEAGIDICLLSLADTRATYGTTLPQDVWEAELRACRTLLEAYWEKSEEVVSPPRLLSGNDLIGAFGLTPGPRIGRLLNAISEAQAAGEIITREDALEFTRQQLATPASKTERSQMKSEASETGQPPEQAEDAYKQEGEV